MRMKMVLFKIDSVKMTNFAKLNQFSWSVSIELTPEAQKFFLKDFILH